MRWGCSDCDSSPLGNAGQPKQTRPKQGRLITRNNFITDDHCLIPDNLILHHDLFRSQGWLSTMQHRCIVWSRLCPDPWLFQCHQSTEWPKFAPSDSLEGWVGNSVSWTEPPGLKQGSYHYCSKVSWFGLVLWCLWNEAQLVLLSLHVPSIYSLVSHIHLISLPSLTVPSLQSPPLTCRFWCIFEIWPPHYLTGRTPETNPTHQIQLYLPSQPKLSHHLP